ncbi:helix-turn-helix domain-containing protein [Thiocapsa marina]|uniref:Helix-turn-helix domain protein n=1 Tax=Thiocapsa marina 5811 TaxID=768671 RepID=F9UH33_9GAMM|nr:helix-turn-helix domain protein [Thiocapsa marina 5811]
MHKVQSRDQVMGERLRTARDHARLTREDVSARLDGSISPSRLANYEQGIRRPALEDVEAIARVLNASPA